MDIYGVYSTAIKVIATGEGDMAQANQTLLEFTGLSPAFQYNHIIRWIGEEDVRLMVYGWKMLEQLIRLISDPSEIEMVGGFIEANISSKIEDEEVSRMKSAAFASMIAKVVMQKGLPLYVEYFTKIGSIDVNYAIFEITVYKNLLIEFDSGVMNAQCKTFIQKDILPILVTRVLGIFQSYKNTKDRRLFAALTSFVQRLPAAIPQAGGADVIFYFLVELLYALDDHKTFTYEIIENIGRCIVTILSIRSMNVHEVLSRMDVCQHLTKVWRMAEYDEQTDNVSPRTKTTLSIVLAYSEYIAQRKKKPETLQLAQNWLDAFVLLKSENKEDICPLLRSLRVLVDAVGIGGDKLLELMKFIERTDIYTVKHPKEFEHTFWIQTFEAFRALVRCEDTLMSTVEGLIGLLADYILTGQCFSTPDSLGPLEGIFKTLKSATTENQAYYKALHFLSKKFTTFLDQFDHEANTSQTLLFVAKIKTAIALAVYKSDVYTVKMFRDIPFLYRVFERHHRQTKNHELIYLITSFVYNVIETYHKFIIDAGASQQITEETRRINGILSILQKMPLVESLCILNYDGLEIRTCKDFLRGFNLIDNVDNVDAYLANELGFNTDQPSAEQMMRRKGYRASLMYCRILLKRCRPQERYELLKLMAKPILCQFIIYNCWRLSTVFHPSYNTGLTKNDLIYIGVEHEENAEHISTERHPNTYFETLGDTLFQLLEYAVAGGLKRCALEDAETQKLLSTAIPSDVGVSGPSYRRWLNKGYRCFSTIAPPQVLFSSLYICANSIVEKYKSLTIDSDGQPICDNEEEREQNLIMIRYFPEMIACIQNVITSSDRVVVKEDGSIVYIPRNEADPFNETVYKCVRGYLLTSFHFFQSVIELNEFESSRAICKILIHAIKHLEEYDEMLSGVFTNFLIRLTGHLIQCNGEDLDLAKQIAPVAIMILQSDGIEPEYAANVFCQLFDPPLNKPTVFTHNASKKWIKNILNID